MTRLEEKVDRVPTCVPIRDMKNTAAFTSLVERAPTPITVTRNGYDTFVVMRSEEYESLQYELARARLLSRVAQAEAEYNAGDYVDGKDFVSGMREEYGL